MNLEDLLSKQTWLATLFPSIVIYVGSAVTGNSKL